MGEIRFTVRFFSMLLIGYEMAVMMAGARLYQWFGLTLPDPIFWFWATLIKLI